MVGNNTCHLLNPYYMAVHLALPTKHLTRISSSTVILKMYKLRLVLVICLRLYMANRKRQI